MLTWQMFHSFSCLNPLDVSFLEIEEKKDKNQANWMRNEENVQIVVIVATTTIHGHDCDSKLREDWW